MHFLIMEDLIHNWKKYISEDMFYETLILYLRRYFFSLKDAKVLSGTDTKDTKITLNVYSIALFL